MINTPNSDRLIQSSGNDNSISGYNFVEPDLGIRWIESPFSGHRYSAPILNAQRRRKSMPRDLPLGNGQMLVAFDQSYQIRDLYWPHVGQENHAMGHPFRTGVWVDGEFRWLDDSHWEHALRYSHETLVTEVGDTAYYEPDRRAVLHYKGSRWFLANGAVVQVEDDPGPGWMPSPDTAH